MSKKDKLEASLKGRIPKEDFLRSNMKVALSSVVTLQQFALAEPTIETVSWV